MYQHLMIYYKCFHQVINDKRGEVCGGKAGPVAGPARQVGAAPAPCGHRGQNSGQTRPPNEQQSLLLLPSALNQTISPSASCGENFVSRWFYSWVYFVAM